MSDDLIPSNGGAVDALDLAQRATPPSVTGFLESGPIVALESGPHLVALLGIVALALLGGGLLIRNRYDESVTVVTDDRPSEDEEFMTDREKVRHLVRTNGGRMKQSEIVEAVDWSKAKVSRLLADLEDDGEITKLRLGRENLICLRGQEPPASKSSDGSGSE